MKKKKLYRILDKQGRLMIKSGRLAYEYSMPGTGCIMIAYGVTKVIASEIFRKINV
jgi:hypothetical protein